MEATRHERGAHGQRGGGGGARKDLFAGKRGIVLQRRDAQEVGGGLDAEATTLEGQEARGGRGEEEGGGGRGQQVVGGGGGHSL